ncbi:MAG: tetratricopeptide repeat protein [Candidatus Aminicenantales bacterium]
MRFLKKKIFAFNILFLFSWGILISQTQEATNIFEKNKNSVLSIVALSEGKTEVAVGAGFVVGPGDLVVTCYHVVSNAYSVEARNAKGKKIKLEGIIQVNKDLDLAVLKMRGKAPALTIGNSDNLGRGNRIFALGGREIVVSEGSAIDILELNPTRRIIQASLTFREGFSGGPLFNIEGEVVGVAVDLGTGLEFFIPVNQVKPLIKSGRVASFKNWGHENYLSTPKGAFLAGRVFLLLGEPGKARNYLEKVVKAEPNNIEAYSSLASANFQIRYYESAASSYKKIIELDPQREEAHYGLGFVYMKMHRYRDAIGPLKKALELNPDNIDTYYQLGNAYEELKDFANALEMYKKYVELEPESKWAGYLRIGVCAKETGNYDESVEAYLKALEERPDDDSIHLKLAETYQIAKRYDEAAAEYEKLCELKPDQETYFYGKIVRMYDGVGEYEKAIKAAEKIVELNPDSELAVYNLGIMYLKLENYDKAVETFKRALTINPNYDVAYYNIGLSYFNQKKYREAIQAFKKFVEITPDNADAWYNIGVGYMQLKDFEAALEPLRKSVELRPDYSLALYNLAITYLNLKDNYSARQVYNKLMNVDASLASRLKKYIK